MSRFWVHDDAITDLEGIWDIHAESAAYIQALLEQLAADSDLRDRMTQESCGVPGLHTFNVEPLAEHQDAGRNVWRLKVWKADRTLRYRIIYAYDHKNDTYCVLAILPRSFAYDSRNERVRQIAARYDELGFPKLPRR